MPTPPTVDHTVTVLPSEVLPRGWPEAWVWTCSCGAESWSIMRSVSYAEADHRTEHLT